MPSKQSIWLNWCVGGVLVVAGSLAVAAGATGVLVQSDTYGMKGEAIVVPILVGLATLALGTILVYPSMGYWARRRRYRTVLASEGV